MIATFFIILFALWSIHEIYTLNKQLKAYRKRDAESPLEKVKYTWETWELTDETVPKLQGKLLFVCEGTTDMCLMRHYHVGYILKEDPLREGYVAFFDSTEVVRYFRKNTILRVIFIEDLNNNNDENN